LIVYGLLDSHTLLSGMSGVRLDSYIYTTDALRDARAKLADGGTICLTFCIFHPEIGRKLYLMIHDAFGQGPVIYQTNYDGGYSFIIGERLPPELRTRDLPGLKRVTEMFAGNRYAADPSTDDWPFFYMPVKKYPPSYVAMIAILLLVSAAFV